MFEHTHFTVDTSGVSSFSGGPTPIAGVPNPGFAGIRLGIAALGVQVDACTGVTTLTEIGNALTIHYP